MNKRGQLQMSFGMIFSIIIIIATVGAGFYFITKFLDTSNCASVGLMKEGLQEKVDKIWASPFGSESITLTLPSGASKICFGNINNASRLYKDIKDELSNYVEDGDNMFIYPPKSACKGGSAAYQINHLENSAFTCYAVKESKVTLKLVKESSSQILVKIKQ